MGMVESVGKLATKAAELVSCIKVMEARFESLEKQFNRLDDANREFIERVTRELDELHRKMACASGVGDSRDAEVVALRREVERMRNSFVKHVQDVDIVVTQPAQRSVPNGASVHINHGLLPAADSLTADGD